MLNKGSIERDLCHSIRLLRHTYIGSILCSSCSLSHQCQFTSDFEILEDKRGWQIEYSNVLSVLSSLLLLLWMYFLWKGSMFYALN